MSLKGFTGSGGGNYLSADDIEEGLEGKILAPPYIGPRRFEAEEKQVCEFPMRIVGMEEDRTWSAGKFAAVLLMQALGENPANWKFPVEGRFELRKWQTTKSKGRAWHFVPDGFQEGQRETPKAEKRSGIEKKEVAQVNVSTSKGKAKFVCGTCGAGFDSVEDMTNHWNKEHKTK